METIVISLLILGCVIRFAWWLAERDEQM